MQEVKGYIQSDKLQKYLDWDNLIKMPRFSGGHDDQMKGLFKGVKVVAHYNEGDYQGEVATCVQFTQGEFKGKFAIYNDYYGSCSGCDSWEGATDIEVKNMCVNLSNGAKVFDSLKAIKVYLKETIHFSASLSLLKRIEDRQID